MTNIVLKRSRWI